MTKGVKICIAVMSLIFAVALIFSFILLSGHDGQYITIVQDNVTLYQLDLSVTENQTIRIEDKNGGFNIVEITDGRVRISDADCHDKTCINTGLLSGDIPIVCLPHKLVIKYSYEDEN